MGEVNDKFEDGKLLVKISKDTIDWASINAFRRIGFLLFIVTVIFGAWYWYLTDLSNKAASDIEIRTQQEVNLSKSNLYKASIDSVDLCLNALEKSTDLKDWYCERALQAYKNRLSKSELERVKELIDKKAYGAMRADLLHKERRIKYNELINRKQTKENQLLDKLLDSTSIAIFLTLIISIYCFVVYWLYKRSPNTNNACRVMGNRRCKCDPNVHTTGTDLGPTITGSSDSTTSIGHPLRADGVLYNSDTGTLIKATQCAKLGCKILCGDITRFVSATAVTSFVTGKKYLLTSSDNSNLALRWQTGSGDETGHRQAGAA